MKTTPVTKLAPPKTSISSRKPVDPSERCGVSTAEKIVGSSRVSLSDVITLIIKKHGQKIDRATDQGGEKGQGCRAQGAAQAGRRGQEGVPRRTDAMDPC